MRAPSWAAICAPYATTSRAVSPSLIHKAPARPGPNNHRQAARPRLCSPGPDFLEHLVLAVGAGIDRAADGRHPASVSRTLAVIASSLTVPSALALLALRIIGIHQRIIGAHREQAQRGGEGAHAGLNRKFEDIARVVGSRIEGKASAGPCSKPCRREGSQGLADAPVRPCMSSRARLVFAPGRSPS